MAWLIFFQHRNSQFQECCDFTYGNRLWREFALSLAANRLSTTCAFHCFRQLNIVQAKHSVFWERSDSVVSGIFRWIRDTGVIIEEDMDEASTRGYWTWTLLLGASHYLQSQVRNGSRKIRRFILSSYLLSDYLYYRYIYLLPLFP